MEKWKMIDPYPGAHIRVKVGKFYHHAIYIGNDEVVQFGYPSDIFNESQKNIKIIRSPISEFLNNGFLEVRIYNLKEKKLKRKDLEIVQIALSKIGEGNYNILQNNCEHFANFCVFGKKTSSQVAQIHEEIRKKLGENHV